MTDETLPPTETRAGVEQIDGTEYEYPYRVEDWHGRVVADDLDTIPPLLNQEQVDILASELEDILAAGGITGFHGQTLATVLRDLPDSEYGRGGLPERIEEQ